MDTALTPIENLKPAFERLRAAHLAHIPSYGERIAALERGEGLDGETVFAGIREKSAGRRRKNV